MADVLLGEGKEGKVYRRGDEVIKVFNDGIFSVETGARIAELIKDFRPPFIENVWFGRESETWIAKYSWFESEPVLRISEKEVVEYLVKAGGLQVIADNFKLSNLRRCDGKLVFIDIGRHIRAFNRSTFRDVCAKAFALLNGMTEQKLESEFDGIRSTGGVREMLGFDRFYERIVRTIAEHFWAKCPVPPNINVADDVTLLIKCCAMDSAYLERQVGHIVHRLSTPKRFKEVVLSIDTRISSFLRQHSSGDLDAVRISAHRLLTHGVIQRVIEAPFDLGVITDINQRWFGVACSGTHTLTGIPVYSQLWAFEQIDTTYVLQADCDVLICRYDPMHDYLSEMIEAHCPPDVMGVGFNIPHPLTSTANFYFSPIGEYKPEVRLGLFDLFRLRHSLPWPNKLKESQLVYGWYQALYQAMKHNGWRCLRGGDPRTVYIHPLNTAKERRGILADARRCVESGWVPVTQHKKWDLIEVPGEWKPPLPPQEVILALNVTHCDSSLARRCASSIAGQDDRGFGVIVVDDSASPATVAELVILLNSVGVQPQVIHGLDVLSGLHNKPQHVLLLGSDEALMSPSAMAEFKKLVDESTIGQKGCLCDSASLRCSARFGLAAMYMGEHAEHHCQRPRCFATSSCADVLSDVSIRYPSCVALDVFAETPAPRGNRLPLVMAGFVVWKERG